MDFERYVNDVADFFDNYPEVQRYVNQLDLDPIYDLIVKEANRLGDDAFHTAQIRLTSCFSYVLIKAGINPIEHVTKIPAYFMCEHNIENLNIDSVKSIGEKAFANCQNLKHVKIYNVDTINAKAFTSCVKLQSVDIQNVNCIENYAFDDCYKLKTINIDDNVSYIGIGAFNDCEKLTSFKWPKNTIDIMNNTFKHCESLQSLELPSTLENISDNVFWGCNKLQSIKFNGTKEQWKKLFKVKLWRKESMISEVICTNGKVTYKVD